MSSGIYNFDLEHLVSGIAAQAKTKLAGKQDVLSLDSTPTLNSTNFVNSGAVYQALNAAMTDAQISALVTQTINDLNGVSGS